MRYVLPLLRQIVGGGVEISEDLGHSEESLVVPRSPILVTKHRNDGFLELTIDLSSYQSPAAIHVIGPERL